MYSALRSKNRVVYGKHRKVIVSKEQSHDLASKDIFSNLKNLKQKNIFHSDSSTHETSGNSTFENLLKSTKRNGCRSSRFYKTADNSATSSNTEAEVSKNKSDSLNLFSTPKLKKPSKVYHPSKGAKARCKRNKNAPDHFNKVKSFNQSSENELPAEDLMRKYDVRNVARKPEINEKIVHFSDFDDVSLVVECESHVNRDRDKIHGRFHLSENKESGVILEQNSRNIDRPIKELISTKSKNNDKRKRLTSKTKHDKVAQFENAKNNVKKTSRPILASTPHIPSKSSSNSCKLSSNNPYVSDADCELGLSVISPIKSSSFNHSLKNPPHSFPEGTMPKFQSAANNSNLIVSNDIFNELNSSVKNVLNFMKEKSSTKDIFGAPLMSADDTKLASIPVVCMERLTVGRKGISMSETELNSPVRKALGFMKEKSATKDGFAMPTPVISANDPKLASMPVVCMDRLAVRNTRTCLSETELDSPTRKALDFTKEKSAAEDIFDRSSVKRKSDPKVTSLPTIRLERLSINENLLDRRKSKKQKVGSFKMASSFLCPVLSADCLQQTFSEAISFCVEENGESAKSSVLKQCRQLLPMSFEAYMSSMQICCKIGEGCYGEVFLFKKSDDTTVVCKVIPVDGAQLINGSKQMKFHEILSEIVLSIVLSTLRDAGYNSSPNFVLAHRVSCLIGKYPQLLLDAWDKFDEEQKDGSENGRPGFFESDQLFISFEFGNGGSSLEKYMLRNGKQAVSVFLQVLSSLAVAEVAYKFEHRDLHLGNILISSTADSRVAYSLAGAEFEVETNSVLATVIDFTLSRMDNEGLTVFCDLSAENNEVIFSGQGDYQYDIYRKMKEHTTGNWSGFFPYTNVLWLHHLLTKLISGVKYKNKKSKIHLNAMKELKAWKKEMLSYKSAREFVSCSNLIS